MVRNLSFYLIFILIVCGWSQNHSFELEKSIYFANTLPFKAHTGSSPYSNYIAMNIPYAPISKVLKKIESHFSKKLISREEAHITVITPPEYDGILSSKLSIHEINQLAVRLNLQSAKFQIHCLGEASILKDNRNSYNKLDLNNINNTGSMFTYFLIVYSEDLVKFRTQINQLFISKGGNPKAFNPKHYYPHITIGFTHRDLHERDGIIKDITTCKANIKQR